MILCWWESSLESEKLIRHQEKKNKVLEGMRESVNLVHIWREKYWPQVRTRTPMTNLDSILKSRDITLPTNVRLVKAISSSHVRVWELDHKEGWVPKNWCFWTPVLEKTFENPLDWKEIQPVHPKGNQSGIFIGRIDAEAEAPTL